jgi:hypothetical protein
MLQILNVFCKRCSQSDISEVPSLIKANEVSRLLQSSAVQWAVKFQFRMAEKSK